MIQQLTDNLIAKFNILQWKISTATQELDDLIAWYPRLNKLKKNINKKVLIKSLST